MHLQRKFNNYYDKAAKKQFTSKAADKSERDRYIIVPDINKYSMLTESIQ